MPQTFIEYYDRTNQPKRALAGSNTQGDTASGHVLFDVDGNPVAVATATQQQALNTAIGHATDLASPAPDENASVIGILKGMFGALRNISLKAGTAVIGRVIMADANGAAYTGDNPVRVRDDASGPSDDCILVNVGTDYSPTYPNGLILRVRTEGTLDVTTKSGNRRVIHFAACETRPIRVYKVWAGANTTATGIEGMV